MSQTQTDPKDDGLRLRARLRYLYHGGQPAAVKFRLTVIVIDFAIIAFFLAAPILKNMGWAFYVLDYLIAALLAIDLAARAYAYSDIKDWLKRPIVWLDLFILATLLFPAWLFNLGFLRMLRLWTLLNSDFFWRTVGARFDDTRVEGIVRALSGLVTFVFVVTGFVYATFRGHDGISGYIDALYFTVATLTTTGFGDVTLPGPLGKLLSIAIMLVGITLFLRLAQALIKPHKVRFPCDRCGLQTHDPDAVHCKACGNLICIPDEG
ncbi:MAG: potassium channel family protein [Brevundimonas sp.]|uniref:Voltage-gated potassium channel n=1 Tax=Brevundimonas mediterranea TaxID=74329 RepID=A0A7W6A6N4_9CAUL|nr:potassium channel family protein [Brevundimonas sp.]MBB3872677.1 voltage-gated potassium channel [Brevundimonas mediterranea]MDK2746467.1 potassium channel family protein [Brevundimonas sp.]